VSKVLHIGTRVRLKVRTMGGWRGTATILAEDGRAIKDGGTDPFQDSVDAVPHQWVVMRDQTPNPEHEAVVSRANARAMWGDL
jgi:hypothetical protein